MTHSRIRSKFEQRQAYIDALARTGSASDAAAVIGVERTTPYYWRRTVPGFAALCDRVRREARAAGARGLKHWVHPAMNDRRLMRTLERMDFAEARSRRVISTVSEFAISTAVASHLAANPLMRQGFDLSSTDSTLSTLSTLSTFSTPSTVSTPRHDSDPVPSAGRPL